ncbi:MAG: methyltransferase domain-containing protein [Desulfomonilaceae bacterium]|nr:methyltransferase domain-containing protein [Desulfomonilaceae bacterium]
MKSTRSVRKPYIPIDNNAHRLKFAHFATLAQAILREDSCGMTPLRILDIGCGPGNLALFCKVPSGCRLFGVDLWPNQLRQAAAREAYEALFQVNLVDGLPFVSESFDVIVCNEVLMYLPNGGEMLSELYRVTAPEGKLLVYNPISWLPRPRSLVKRLTRKIYREKNTIALDFQSDWKGSERPCRITYYSFQSLIEQIRSVNFHVTGIAGFRLFRNRIRLMTRLEDFSWYRRTVLFLTERYPRLASDLLVLARKKSADQDKVMCLDKAAA